MELYGKADYAGALPILKEAASLDSESPGPQFFAGICELLQGQPGEAAASFQRVIALGESPYLEKAQFYLAKALLRKGDLTGAARALDETVRLKGDLEVEARQLREAVRSKL